MTRTSQDQHAAAAFVVLVAGTPQLAAAQPVPLEGPAINPSVYKVPAGAKTIDVDCDGTQTLAGAMADKSTGDLNIVFSGTCREYVYLQRDGVAIRGKDATRDAGGRHRGDRRQARPARGLHLPRQHADSNTASAPSSARASPCTTSRSSTPRSAASRSSTRRR